MKKLWMALLICSFLLIPNLKMYSQTSEMSSVSTENLFQGLQQSNQIQQLNLNSLTQIYESERLLWAEEKSLMTLENALLEKENVILRNDKNYLSDLEENVQKVNSLLTNSTVDISMENLNETFTAMSKTILRKKIIISGLVIIASIELGCLIYIGVKNALQ